MPRLDSQSMAARRQAVISAARKCFITRGFHGVSVRDIAREAGCSLGKLYGHFPDKLSLYRRVVSDASAEFLSLSNPLAAYLREHEFPAELEKLAQAVSEMVEQYDDYFRLAYVDAVDFGGRHVRPVFSSLEERFRQTGMLSGALPNGTDRSFAFTASYLSFLHFFMLSRQFGATRVYRAANDREVIQKLVQLFRHGVSS